METKKTEWTEEASKGCVLLIVYTMFALFLSLAVGFIFGTGYGFLTAAVLALLSLLKYRRALKREKKDAERD